MLQSSINSHLDKLQANLAMENKVMDELARQTTLLKTQSVKLSQAKNEMDELKSERVVVKSCVGDVNALLSNLIEAHDSVLTITIRRHLAENLRPAISMLSRIEGVPEASIPPKQGGEVTQDPPNQPPTSETQDPPVKPKVSNEPKGNEALGLKAKGKKIVGESDEEEE